MHLEENGEGKELLETLPFLGELISFKNIGKARHPEIKA
jgi:hypothetical protein